LSSLSTAGDCSCFSHLSLFGDAALSVIEGQRLPAVEALHVAAVAKDRVHKPVLLPVCDCSETTEAVRLLCEQIDVENAEIHLLYVHGDDSQTNDGATPRSSSRSPFAKVARQLARYGLSARHQVTRRGDLADQILDYANQIHAALIVLGSPSQTCSESRFAAHDVTQRVLGTAKCPVLIARAEVTIRPPSR
jgi:nucleotide-binding universal stress UspA family protein